MKKLVFPNIPAIVLEGILLDMRACDGGVSFALRKPACVLLQKEEK